MQILVPTPLRSYTGGSSEVEASGSTLAEVLAHLDATYPGIRFRMIDEQDRVREHIRFFVDGELVQDLEALVAAQAPVQIVCALSGG